jgi:hypothetical protein
VAFGFMRIRLYVVGVETAIIHWRTSGPSRGMRTLPAAEKNCAFKNGMNIRHENSQRPPGTPGTADTEPYLDLWYLCGKGDRGSSCRPPATSLLILYPFLVQKGCAASSRSHFLSIQLCLP